VVIFALPLNQAEKNVCIKLKVRFHTRQEKAEKKKIKQVLMLRKIKRNSSHSHNDERGHEINERKTW
jgi:hypothetical protein